MNLFDLVGPLPTARLVRLALVPHEVHARCVVCERVAVAEYVVALFVNLEQVAALCADCAERYEVER